MIEQVLKLIPEDGTKVARGYAAFYDRYRGVRAGEVEEWAFLLASRAILLPSEGESVGTWLVAPMMRGAVRSAWTDMGASEQTAIASAAQRTLAILEAWSKTPRD